MINVLSYQILASPIPEKNIKKQFKYNKFKTSASTWNNKFELPGGSYSVSYYQKNSTANFLAHTKRKKQQKRTDKLPVRIYVNKIELILKLNQDMILSPQFLAPQAINLRKSTENKVTKNKKVENIPHLILLM